MTQLQPQNIVEKLNSLELLSTYINAKILFKKQELENLELVKEIKELELQLKEITQETNEIKEEWKQILINAWMKKFEALDWTIIQLNQKPGALVIEDESKIPQEYFKEKITKSLDKTSLKNDIKEWLIIEWATIEVDYNLVIKNPK